MQSIYEFKAIDINGHEVSLSDYKDQVLLIVNTASKCGFTKQYEALEELYEKYQKHGFTVLGFPCNQFGAQEPGDALEIKNFCSLNYAVKFPLFAKIEVNGKNAHPLYKYLKARKSGFLGLGIIKWNFTKFLIDKKGKVIGRYAPTKDPYTLAAKIEKLLK